MRLYIFRCVSRSALKMYHIQLFAISLTCLIFCCDILYTSGFPEKLTKLVNTGSHNPDYGLNIIQFLEKYGYPLEIHEVTTEDGYILTLHRIPYGRNGPRFKKPAILVMHPLLSSSIDMVNLGPGKSIGLMLVDEGYDVWLGNIRGNVWSRKHVTLDPDTDKAFWDFSFDEAGLYDLSTKIDYILNVTGHNKISYLGHSQGSTEFFVLTTLRPEYNEKITIMVAFAPVTYVKNVTQPLVRLFVDHRTIVDLILDFFNINEFLPHSQLIPELTKTFCCDGSITQELCSGFIFYLVGWNSPQLNRTFLEVIGSNAPAGTSTKTLKHFAQLIESGSFRRFNYNLLKNLNMYKQPQPPTYNLSLVTAPVAIYYGGEDFLCPPISVEQLAEELPNVAEKRYIDYFNHLDFIWAKDANSILYKDVIKLLNKYNNDKMSVHQIFSNVI